MATQMGNNNKEKEKTKKKQKKNGIPHEKQESKCHAKRKRKSIIGILMISDKSKIKTGILFLESFFFWKNSKRRRLRIKSWLGQLDA